MDRITAIEKSLTVFVCGIIGFLPVLGLLPAVHALVSLARVRARYGGEWNPASAYLRAGAVLATLGVLGSMLVIAVVCLAIANAFD
jgi:hypothetical protein